MLGLCDPVQKAMMREYGNNGTIHMDETFGARPFLAATSLSLIPAVAAGSNNLRYPLCTIMATDKTGHGVPVAFIITSSSSAETYATVLDSYRQHVGTDIRPTYILVDDAAAEIGAIKQCEWGKEGTLVALCTWHVKRSWLKALISKVRGKDAVTSKSARVQLLKSLGRIVEAKVLPPQRHPPPPLSMHYSADARRGNGASNRLPP